mmetsp:Transcript_19311/g.41545  ORF Transcript_19311/g.41545 Transcript_19311/m.41545 type:complete len:226 (-) Transcript_19311:203-880(-)|eukprot:CAMPEP_0168739576 /NCGR_PEP_ID=MMETSP0724-20121128/11535_1 /TAXON_ID=265536 /ORGANISM="Amphiprora sp., Strain CCMP467" /LENGTH=225 /DNA_ID=CAMNT_0008786985 /DNA_START=109 /DNA_END=786 /DNA_ORIENTATION=-
MALIKVSLLFTILLSIVLNDRSVLAARSLTDGNDDGATEPEPCQLAMGVAKDNPGCSQEILNDIMKFIDYPIATECKVPTPPPDESNRRNLRGAKDDGRELMCDNQRLKVLCRVTDPTHWYCKEVWFDNCGGRRRLSDIFDDDDDGEASSTTPGPTASPTTSPTASPSSSPSSWEDPFGEGWEQCQGAFPDFVHDIQGILERFANQPDHARCFGAMWCQVKNRPT